MQNQPETQDALAQVKALLAGTGAVAQKVQLQGTGPIGIDFGLNRVYATQLYRKGSQLRIASSASAPYPGARESILNNTEALRELTQELLQNNGFRGNHAVVSAPLGEPKVLSLTFKSASPQDIPRHVIELVKERLGGGEQDWLVDYLPVKLKVKNSQDTMVMAAAMPRRSSLEFMENLQLAGLYLRAVEIAPQALERLLKQVETPQANCVVIHFGQHKSYLSHFLQGKLTMDREIPVGLEDFVSPVSELLSVEKSLARNIFHTLGFGESSEMSPLLNQTFDRLKVQIDLMNQYIASQLHGDGINCIYLTGDIANWSQASEAFSRKLGIQTKILNPFELLPQNANNEIQRHDQAMYSIAAGLAMRWAS
ncbi:MAG: pilus assembly protein PilM [Granulosicoccaceae bacterium]